MTIDAKTLGQAILDATFSTTIAKTETFQLAMKDFPIEAILSLLAHGAQRKFNDAVGGADKDAKTKVGLAKAMIEDFKNGKLAKRREVTPVDAWGAMARKFLRSKLTDFLSTEQVKAFRAKDAAEQTKLLDGWAEANRDAIDAPVKEMIRIAAETKAAGDGLAIKLSF